MWHQNWGQMIWGGGAAVPATGPLVLLLLGGVLALVARWMIRNGGWAKASAVAGLGVLVLIIPFSVWALSLPFTFTNGSVADATQVNTNFATLTGAVTDLQSRAPNRTFVGTATVTGNVASLGSYTVADQRCQAVFAGSFVCTPQEILQSNRQGLLPSSGGGTVVSGMAGITPPNVADCRGFSGEGFQTGVNFTASGPFFLMTQNGCTSGLASFNLTCCR